MGILLSARMDPSGSFGGAAGVLGLWCETSAAPGFVYFGPPALGVLQPGEGPWNLAPPFWALQLLSRSLASQAFR